MIFLSLLIMSALKVLFESLGVNNAIKESESVEPLRKVDLLLPEITQVEHEANTAEKAAYQIDDVEERKDIRFNPPLYYQRYMSVSKVIQQFHQDGAGLQRLLDVGCAECKFLKRAIQIPFLEEINGLDIDRRLVTQKFVTHSLQPLTTDYLHKRARNLQVKVFAGSIAERDPVMLEVDVVTAIEVIEHLHQPVLDGFVDTVFSYIQPKLVIVTTPNSEFNVLFPNFSGMRHWDHKFEWTRKQFQYWGDSLCRQYSYTVNYDGVGEPPTVASHLGPCSQMAVFVRKESNVIRNIISDQNNGIHTTQYEQVFFTIYPGHYQTEDEILDNEILYTVTSESHLYIQDNVVEDLSCTPIPIQHLLACNRTLKEKLSVSTLRQRLEKLDYEVSEDGENIVINMERSNSPSDEGNDKEDTAYYDADQVTDPEPLWG